MSRSKRCLLETADVEAREGLSIESRWRRNWI